MNTETTKMFMATLEMFAFLAVELTVLFLVISYLVGVLQTFLPPEKIQSILGAKKGKGYVIAALFGSITPFCSCSTIPFLKGLLNARAGFGPMMVFLFASPLLNPVIIGLFVVMFGWQVAIFYFFIAISVSVSAGYLLEKLGFERYIKPEAYQQGTDSCSVKSKQIIEEKISCCVSQKNKPNVEKPKTACSVESGCAPQKEGIKKEKPWMKIWRSTWKDFKQVFPYLLLGISIGSAIYGFVPTDLIIEYAGENKWYAIPIAAVIGIPLYIRAEAVIPLSAALVQKGMALGSVMALIIGSAGASLTEVFLLKSLFKRQMIAAFLSVILIMAMSAGYLYSLIMV